MGLIGGVIQAGSQLGVQCLQAVTNLTGIATSSGGTTFSSAADLAQWAKDTGHLLSTPTPGDIAVWGAGQGGASGGGHAGIVSGLGGGGVQVSSTNWPGGSGETQYTVGKGNNPVGMGDPLGYINPNVLGGKNLFTGVTSTTGLQQTGSSITAATGYKSLSSSVSDAVTNGGLGSTFYGPIVGFENWVTQGTLLRRIGFTAVGVFLIWYGLHLLTRGDVASPVQTVTKVVPK